MGMQRMGVWVRRAFALAVTLALVVVAGPALAAGRVKVSDAQPKEEDGRWLLKFEIDYGRTPDLPHIPMLFSFKKTMHYERALTDESPEKPIESRLPLSNQPPIDLDMDVGFSDPNGTTFKVTKFSMKLARSNQFEAGEYELTVTDKRANSKVGTPLKITLRGDNPVIDRKSIVFHSDSGKKKKKEPAPADSEEVGAGNDQKGGTAAEDMGPDLSDIDEKPAEGPPETKPKQKSGGCAVGGEPASGEGALMLVALALGWLGRRRAPFS